MPTSVPSFDTLRPWEGVQSRAIEELYFQLLMDLCAATRAIRTGNPDGGVEWYAVLPNGDEWGRQAEHVHGIDPLLTAMTESVTRVTKERPTLRLDRAPTIPMGDASSTSLGSGHGIRGCGTEHTGGGVDGQRRHPNSTAPCEQQAILDFA